MSAPGRPVRWGVLGTARIATQKVIPGIQRSAVSDVLAIASRDLARARAAASELGIPKAHGTYEALLDDPDVEAVYIPLPNHLHVLWSSRAAERGKHVLCEKPIGMTAAEAERLLAVRDRARVVIQEAFMIRAHPQWRRAIALVREGRLGTIQAVVGHFSYFNVNPTNIRNIAEFGGGGLMDIGCYLVHVARWVFDREPERIVSLVDRDPGSHVDRVTSMLLDFGAGQAVGMCATQLVPYQRIHVLGARARIEVEIPFNAPAGTPCRIFVDDGSDLRGGGIETLTFDPCDQYTAQADAFAAAIRDGVGPLVPLEDSIANMRVLDAIVRSAASGRWERGPTG